MSSSVSVCRLKSWLRAAVSRVSVTYRIDGAVLSSVTAANKKANGIQSLPPFQSANRDGYLAFPVPSTSSDRYMIAPREMFLYEPPVKPSDTGNPSRCSATLPGAYILRAFFYTLSLLAVFSSLCPLSASSLRCPPLLTPLPRTVHTGYGYPAFPSMSPLLSCERLCHFKSLRTVRAPKRLSTSTTFRRSLLRAALSEHLVSRIFLPAAILAFYLALFGFLALSFAASCR